VTARERTAPAVVLRPAGPEDRDRLREWRNLPEISRWMYSDHEISPQEHARWFEAALADPGRIYWVIEADGTPVGLANLYDISPKDRKATWAYYLADPSVRGKGIGAYVEYLVIEAVFGQHGLNKLWCEVLSDNKGVVKLHLSFGFRQEALYRAHVWKAGAPCDVVGLGLLAEDWTQIKPACVERLRALGFAL